MGHRVKEAVSIKTTYTMSWRARFNSWQALGSFLLASASRQVLGPTQHPIQWVMWFLSLGVK